MKQEGALKEVGEIMFGLDEIGRPLFCIASEQRKLT